MNELTRNQAMLPDKCRLIQNQVGTAPCMWFEYGESVLIAMPGVPHEMKWLMTNEIIPRLKQTFPADVCIRHHTLWVSGYGESALAQKLSTFEEELPNNVKLAYLPQPGLVRLRLTVSTDDENESNALQLLSAQKEKLQNILGEHILSDEDKSPELLIGETLLAKGLRMATAESCTGGRIAALLTSIAGSSRYFAGGVVAYSNEVKHRLLGVSAWDLQTYGAVSRQVVEQMAIGAASALACDCAVATSGIAGPDGGTADKPVGTVWIAAAWEDRVVSDCFHFSTVREMNIARSSHTALLMLLKLLKG
jgi:nicotinamide-nucleotide amidase